ncbi:Protein phosphatase 1 regulatory inhibitor subunit [Paragonimus heterotremus]|uniref:Protein phosphatase 1 regulatory inhibitor subunit n=1 Tax=Paragonimus heterotremus TaxID=100268 RepID=A0A8J4WKN3_9TREM|nr:Protein phosphatase 1 regulatory inhibitor subunit [Paragonimus heterotremus]
MTETVMKPRLPSLPSAGLQQHLQNGRIDIRRLEAARTNRQIQLKNWDEYDRRMEMIRNDNHSSKIQKSQRGVKFRTDYMLLDAALRDDVDEVRYLLAKGINPNVAKDDGITALHQACINNSGEMCEVLIKYGADVNSRDADQWTPLHAAATNGHTEICEYLLSKGADLLAINVDCSIPYDLADDEETSQFLLDELTRRGYSPADVEAARLAPENMMLVDVIDQYNNGENLNKLNEQGAAPIHVAAACGYSEVAKVLLRLGIDPDSLDADGWTPAHVAVFWGQVEVLELLIAHGADLNLTTPDGQTAFSLCESDELHERVVEIWNQREQLKSLVRADRTYSASKPLQRKRRQSSVHRSSLREKTNFSKREARQEIELLESTKNIFEEGSNDDLSSVRPDIHKNPNPTTRLTINQPNSQLEKFNRPYSPSDVDTSEMSPSVRKKEGNTKERVIIIRPPTAYDVAYEPLSENSSAYGGDHVPTKPGIQESVPSHDSTLDKRYSSTYTTSDSKARPKSITIVDKRSSQGSRDKSPTLDRKHTTENVSTTNTMDTLRDDRTLSTVTVGSTLDPKHYTPNDQQSQSSNYASCCRNCNIL